MRCPSCGFENPEGMKFCGQCAAPLQNLCPNCGFENPPHFNFCGNCGTPLKPPGAATTSEEKPTSPRQSRRAQAGRRGPRAERRQLTVMFCDLVGSTALSTQLDPEVLREVVREYQESCAAVINRYEGYIAQYLGDGVLVYFGYPQAHEDDAQRAVRSGLEILEEMQKLNARLQREVGVTLAVRVGIHTGLVVVGEIGGRARREQLALGETPNVAARLQSLAKPNTLVISVTTHRLVRGFFDCLPLGAHPLKGISQPIELLQVLHESGAQSRLEVAATAGLTPLVGKDRELELLLKCWQQTKENAGQVILLNGEAGIGKSRLLQAFKEHVAKEPHTWQECRCSPYHQNSALYPVIDLFHRKLELRREVSPEEKLSKLEAMLDMCGYCVKEVVTLFADLLAVPLGERYQPLGLAPQRHKQKTLEALLAVLRKIADQQPVVFIVEDLHWADPSTLELLTLFMAQKPHARILTLLTFRPEFTPPWSNHADLINLNLNRLTKNQSEVMIEQVTAGKKLPAEMLKQIVTRTDGIPLFVEELTKMILESGLLEEKDGYYELRGSLPPLAIPTTLYDSLMARLDRLAPVKEIAQIGATLGREFSYELIRAVSLFDDSTLQNGLARLIEAQLLYQQESSEKESTYIFKHALIQEAAYQSLLKSTRQQYHQRIAQVLVEKFPENTSTQPELLAHHYTEAGIKETAIAYWQWAGERTLEHSANVEAINHLNKGLELLATLPETPARDQQELDLLNALGLALIATKGYADPEVEKTYTRACVLCKKMGKTHQYAPVLLGLWEGSLLRAELQRAYELAQEFMRLAQSGQDPGLLISAYLTVGITSFYLGKFVAAREHLQQGITLYNPQHHSTDIFLYGQDPGVVCLSFLAHVLWVLGYPDQALEKTHEALALARELNHPFTLALAFNFAGEIRQLRREIKAAQENAEALIALATEQEFPFWLAGGIMLKGYTLFEQEQKEEGVAQMRRAVDAFHATGTTLGEPGGLAIQALMYGKIGQMADGLKLMEEAFTLINHTAERTMEADVYRIKGELLLMQATSEQVKNSDKAAPVPSLLEQRAEACFHQAIDIARHQQAKSWELRAVMSLSRLWQKQGKKQEARKLLAEIYGWFTEGFDTGDLQEAKTLLDELS